MTGPADPALYTPPTYERTAHLEALATGAKPLSFGDVRALWATYCEGCDDAGVPPTLVEFGQWMAGTPPFERPADLVW